LILYKTTNSAVCPVCVLGIVLLSAAGQASAESFLSVIRHLVMTPNSDDMSGLYSASGNAHEPELDRVSEKCIGCHDGVKATNIVLKSARSPREFSGHQSLSHPVGMNYGDYVHTLPFEYRPMEALTTAIYFVDGKVSCVSCHRSSAISCPSSLQLNSSAGGAGLCQACLLM